LDLDFEGLKVKQIGRNDEFDIIVLTETHLDNSIENRDIELDSFDKNSQRKDRTNSGGALLIYSKEDIAFVGNTNLKRI
jgi:hypothetical protein